ncbi:hypothetical protein JXA88_15250 [Candidatus Fermentibacteria bacterium]|nr:hypothetical protein [Candidatus Fermentibacteria bacterium]
MRRYFPAGVALLALAANGAVAAWTERPSLGASLRLFRSDRELKLSGAGAYSLTMPWLPSLRWESSGRMTRVGALNRDKRDSSMRASLDVAPWDGLSLRLSTSGWRRRDEGSQLLERATGAAAEGRMVLDLPAGLTFAQGVAAIRDRVASAGLSGGDTDNGGERADTEIGFSRRCGDRSVAVQWRRAVKRLRLDGLDERGATLRLDGGLGQADVEGFSNRRRYVTGSTQERRTDRGGSLRMAGAVGDGFSWEYRGSTSSTEYLEGTNQDFATGSHALRIQIQTRLGSVAPFIRMNLRHRSYDEHARTIYDREDVGRAVEAGVQAAGLDSVMTARLTHQVSLDRNTYLDVTNFSDHDIRDQRIAADLAWQPGPWSWKLTLSRRRNDLVYIDAERSANTVKNLEYSVSLAYGLQLPLLRWSQSCLISARYADYRFKPDSDALSRRGVVESRLGTQRGMYEFEVYQKWLWDDNGPFRDERFARLELIDDLELGARMGATWGRWRTAPSVRQRWRFLYGPQGRQGGLSRSAQRERRVGIDLHMPVGSRGVTVAATRVTTGGAGYWEASAEVGYGL